MSTIATRLAKAPRNTKLSLYGLAIAIVGLVIQWIADPSKFPGFPPGVIVIAVFGALVAFGIRWWWSPIFAVLISVWIVIGGFLGGELVDNLASGAWATIIGNVVMCIGLVIAAITGVLAMIDGRRRRTGEQRRRA
jgi:hypothetical protein